MNSGGGPVTPVGPGLGRGTGPMIFVQHAHHGHPLFWLLCLVILLLLIGLVVWLAVRLAGRSRVAHHGAAVAGPAGDGALESVRLRYARGEIARDEFVRVSSDLGAPPPPA